MTTEIKKRILFIYLYSFLPFSLWAVEGLGVAFKANLSGTLYKHFSFVLAEDIRPRNDFREAGWFLTTVEFNYQILPYLRTGIGYMSIARFKESNQLRNRYYLYITGSHRFGALKIGLRERFQSTYRRGRIHPSNYLRSLFTISYRIGHSKFEPFIYIEPFNNVGYKGKMHTDKIRYSTGCDYQINPKNRIRLYYRYHTFNCKDPVNYRHGLGITYSHRL